MTTAVEAPSVAAEPHIIPEVVYHQAARAALHAIDYGRLYDEADFERMVAVRAVDPAHRAVVGAAYHAADDELTWWIGRVRQTRSNAITISARIQVIRELLDGYGPTGDPDLDGLLTQIRDAAAGRGRPVTVAEADTDG